MTEKQKIEEHKNIAAAICAVMGDVPAVGKSGKADKTQGGYAYTSDSDLLRALQPAMVRHGLAIYPSDVKVQTFEHEFKYNKGVRVDLVVTYSVHHRDSEEVIHVVAPGCGLDTQDKAHAKAMTTAFKYALRQLFAVPTGEDAERGTVADPPPPKKAEPPPARDAGWPVNFRQLRYVIGDAMGADRWSQNQIAAALGHFGVKKVIDLKSAGAVADLKLIFEGAAGYGFKQLGIADPDAQNGSNGSENSPAGDPEWVPDDDGGGME